MRKAWREGKRIPKQTNANLTHLPPLTLNTVHLPDNPENHFTVATRPAPLQRRAFELLDVDPVRMFPERVQVE